MKKTLFLVFAFFGQLQAFRVVDYNINFYVDWQHRKDKIARMFQELDPDVILLQEIEKPQAHELSKILKYFWDKNAWHTDGITIFSKYKILRAMAIYVPNSPNGAVAVKIKPNIWVVSVHLDDLKYKKDDSLRLREMKYILDQVKKLNPERVILGGDFNSLEDSVVHDLLVKNGFIDTHKNKKWTRGTWMPAGNIERIDRIYIKGKLKVVDGKTLDHENFAWLTTWPSGDDHRLVMTDLSL